MLIFNVLMNKKRFRAAYHKKIALILTQGPSYYSRSLAINVGLL